VASAIKSSPGTANTAVIVLASQKNPYDDAKGKAAGVDDHVLKPFDTQLVIDKVKQVMGRPRMAPAAGAKPVAPPPAPPMAMSVQEINATRGSRTGTIAFGKAPLGTAPGTVAAPMPPSPPMGMPQRPAPVAAPAAAVAMRGGDDLSAKLDGMGLTPDQVAGVLALTRDVVERVVWEVVPELAETLIKEEIRRLTR